MASRAREVAKDTKAAVAPLFVTLKVVDQKDNRLRHTMRRTDMLQVLMDLWYRTKRPDVVKGTGTFWLEEVCVRGGQTPAELGLEDGELIDFFEQQLGGGLVA